MLLVKNRKKKIIKCNCISFFLLCLLLSFHYNKIFHIKITIDNSYNISIPFSIDNNLSFNIINPRLYFSNKFKLTQYIFHIQVSDSKYNPISPSNLALYYKLHVICFSEINNSININSLASILDDKYFKCIEFSKLNEHIKFGFIIYESDNNIKIHKKHIHYYISNKFFNLKYKNDYIFEHNRMIQEYSILLSKLQKNNSLIDLKRLKNLYIKKPFGDLKRNCLNRDNKWKFINIFNEYFCICKGFNCLNKISSSCKYYFYLYLIDINRNIYKKTDFLLIDFVFKKYSADDVYPLFEEMIKLNLSAHYYTEKDEIHDKFCKNKKYCNLIVHADEKNYKINGDFLEKHFSLIIKLKQVLSAQRVDINYINNLFYDIDYITYICVGHGVSYFKYYLYEKFYGPQNFDKLLLPNSTKLISMAQKYGWNDNNIIKFNLPRWDKYFHYNKSLVESGNITQNSIFIMFTWRELKKHKKVSSYYIDNILNLLNNEILINHLFIHNLTLYFSVHHQFLKYSYKFKKVKYIKYIEEKDVAECLSKTNLLVSDFSSIIFDMIFRKKPYIIYIPDANDSKIQKIYKPINYNVIKNFINNDFQFENIYFDINSTINKIEYYIDNEFKLDNKLIKFYNEFNFKNESIKEFINYLLLT